MNPGKPIEYSPHLGSACHTVEYQGAKSLAAHTTNGKIWGFPWTHFVAAEHQWEAAEETLRFTFSSAEVVIEGIRLLPLLQAALEFRLAAVCVFPEGGPVRQRDNTPHIRRIIVENTGSDEADEDQALPDDPTG